MPAFSLLCLYAITVRLLSVPVLSLQCCVITADNIYTSPSSTLNDDETSLGIQENIYQLGSKKLCNFISNILRRRLKTKMGNRQEKEKGCRNEPPEKTKMNYPLSAFLKRIRIGHHTDAPEQAQQIRLLQNKVVYRANGRFGLADQRG